jgi:DNA polymerase (family X)
MTNKQIAGAFDLLAKLMELHDENPFKIKSYASAFASLRKLEGNISEMEDSVLTTIPGVGGSIVEKIREMLSTGDMDALKKMRDKTPAGVIEMLKVKGLGPKKVKQIWKEMEIETIGELLYACQENRLVSYKGFGEKLQSDIQEKAEYFLSSQGRYLYGHVIDHATELLEILRKNHPDNRWELNGDIRRAMPEVEKIQILTTTDLDQTDLSSWLTVNEETDVVGYKGWPVAIEQSAVASFDQKWYEDSCDHGFLARYGSVIGKSEAEILASHQLPFIPASCRNEQIVEYRLEHKLTDLIQRTDIKGIVHNHSTYSDGLHSLKDMSDYVKSQGYEYFVISDHSKSAGYAGGLQVERVYQQMREIDELNKTYGSTYKVYKSIESDILVDGSLDYDDELLGEFDLVIASVHSVLNMDELTATKRLIKAIEHPATRILGHPTGRLLLSRKGYPIDYRKIVDACAANHIVIELNANPQRLDIDWTHIPYCMEKGVMIAINPDAHSKESIHYIRHGVAAAQKGGLTKAMCLNTMSRAEFEVWVGKKI